MNRLAPALGVVDRAYLVPAASDPEYPLALADICRREWATLVFPLIDPDIPVLARERARIEQTGAQVVVLADWAMRLTQDKWLTTHFFQRIGLAAPRSWLPEDIGGAGFRSRFLFARALAARRKTLSRSTMPTN